MTSASMNMDVLVEPIQQNTVPMLSFPIEYVHGPVNLSGTMGGLPVTGIGSFERTHALYRDFELAIVLSDSVKSLPAEATSPAGIGVANILATIAQVSALIDARDFVAATALANSTLRTELQALTEPSRSHMLQILNDLVAVIGVYGALPGQAP
jgi:hypothetical protein